MIAPPSIQPCPAASQSVAAPRFASRQKAEQAARDFEALFLRQIVGDMRQNAEAFGEGLFGAGAGSQIQEGWFDHMLAERMAATGRVGLADSLLGDFERRGWVPAAGDDRPAPIEGLRSLSTGPLRDHLATMPRAPDLAALPAAPDLATLPTRAAHAELATLPVAARHAGPITSLDAETGDRP